MGSGPLRQVVECFSGSCKLVVIHTLQKHVIITYIANITYIYIYYILHCVVPRNVESCAWALSNFSQCTFFFGIVRPSPHCRDLSGPVASSSRVAYNCSAVQVQRGAMPKDASSKSNGEADRQDKKDRI